MPQELLEPGTYRGRAIEADFGYTSTGKEQVAVLFEFLDFPGVHRTWYGYFTENTVKRTAQSLRAAGWTGNNIGDLSSLCPGKAEVNLVVTHEPDQNGVLRDRIAWVNSTGGLGLKTRMSEAEKAEFAQRMNGTILLLEQSGELAPQQQAPAAQAAPAAHAKASTVRRPAPKPAAAKPGNGGQDIPF